RLNSSLSEHAMSGRPFRLITSTYMGATQANAAWAIARLKGAQVRISFDGRRSRLHAKAWLFERGSGYSTAYIGSANISASALSDGLEWMMKVTQADLPHVLDSFKWSFESLW